MFCELIELRRTGLRLAPKDWPAPVRGDLRVEYENGKNNNSRRPTGSWCEAQAAGSCTAVSAPCRSFLPAMADSLIWSGQPTTPGWYAVVVDYGHLPFPAARRWTGTLWDDERGIKAFEGPHDTAAEALDWAMERCPDG